eukprot:scaffold14015_cov48-Phaeocystis_antarctica.AAC.1
MFRVRVPSSTRPPAERLPCVRLAPPPRPPPSRLPPSTLNSLATRQGATKFNEPLNFDTSSVTSMEEMFKVRVPSTRPPAERLSCVPLAPPPHPPPSLASRPVPRPA